MIDGGDEAILVEDELSLSCHLVLRRNWNGVRSTITLVFAHDRVSDVCTCMHIYACEGSRAHNRRFLSDASWQWQLRQVACLKSPACIWKRDSMILISRRGTARGYCYASPPPLEGGTPFTCHFRSLLKEEYKRESRRSKASEEGLWW